ncbi:hypothetical protein KY331_01520 [Candidatus Woesearchaeota archaeon]|nr:hypothetical protein [Candidatus Woesearchaeota archaeon]
MFGKKRSQQEIAVDEANQDLDNYLKDHNYRFTFDTNYLIVLAENNEENILMNIANCPGYIFTSTNLGEIIGILKGGRLEEKAAKILGNFFIKARKRFKKVDFSKYEKELRPFADLLPRKLVHDVVISLEDSFLNNLIRLYENLRQKTLSRAAYKTAAEYYGEEKRALPKKMKQRYEFLCEEYNIDRDRIGKDDEKKYFENANLFKDRLIHEIELVVKQNITKGFDVLIKKIKELAEKTYKADIRFVAETIARSATLRSFDSDVIWLFHFHAVRKIA